MKLITFFDAEGPEWPLAPWPVAVTVLMEPVPTETPRMHQWRRDRLWFWGCLVHSFPTVSENLGPRQVERAAESAGSGARGQGSPTSPPGLPCSTPAAAQPQTKVTQPLVVTELSEGPPA